MAKPFPPEMRAKLESLYPGIFEISVEDWVRRFKEDDSVYLAIITSMERSVGRFPGVIDLKEVPRLMNGALNVDLTQEEVDKERLSQPA